MLSSSTGSKLNPPRQEKRFDHDGNHVYQNSNNFYPTKEPWPSNNLPYNHMLQSIPLNPHLQFQLPQYQYSTTTLPLQRSYHPRPVRKNHPNNPFSLQQYKLENIASFSPYNHGASYPQLLTPFQPFSAISSGTPQLVTTSSSLPVPSQGYEPVTAMWGNHKYSSMPTPMPTPQRILPQKFNSPSLKTAAENLNQRNEAINSNGYISLRQTRKFNVARYYEDQDHNEKKKGKYRGDTGYRVNKFYGDSSMNPKTTEITPFGVNGYSQYNNETVVINSLTSLTSSASVSPTFSPTSYPLSSGALTEKELALLDKYNNYHVEDRDFKIDQNTKTQKQRDLIYLARKLVQIQVQKLISGSKINNPDMIIHTFPFFNQNYITTDTESLSIDISSESMLRNARLEQTTTSTNPNNPKTNTSTPCTLLYNYHRGPNNTFNIYFPVWKRRITVGNTREFEAWCGCCQTWEQLRNSKWRYHMLTFHGLEGPSKRVPRPTKIRVTNILKNGNMLEGYGNDNRKNVNLRSKITTTLWTILSEEGYCPTCQNWVKLHMNERKGGFHGKRNWRKWFTHFRRCNSK